MILKFEYKKLQFPQTSPITGNFVSRPLIPIHFKDTHTGNWIGYEMLLDSGADWNILPAEFGELLGIDIKSGQKQIFGKIDSGSFTAYFHDLELAVGGPDGHTFKVPTSFSYDVGDKDYGVLGQYGFFNKCTVKFDYVAKRIIEIKV